MMTESGTFYKIVVTSCLLLGANYVSLSSANGMMHSGLSHALFNLHYPPSAVGDRGLFFTDEDLAASESGSIYGDGALGSVPLHELTSLHMLGYPFIRSPIAPQEPKDDLVAAGQSYFIEPPTSTTTTQRPTFKKRKTRRPISSLAEKSKKAKEAEPDNGLNNEVYQGNPAPFNPIKKIVKSSFGRTRPFHAKKQERQKTRANAVKQESSDAGLRGTDSPVEAPKSEGEPRVFGRRRPAQDARPVIPTLSGSDESNPNEPPKPRRFPLRKAKPIGEDGAAVVTIPTDDTSANNNEPPTRPRNFARRPRPTTTISTQAEDTDIPTLITEATLGSNPTSPQSTVPAVVTEFKPRVRPVRPPGVSRFTNANRNPVTTLASTGENGEDVPVSASPVPDQRRRRPLLPTTKHHSFGTSTQAPEGTLGSTSTVPVPVQSPTRGRGGSGQKQGFLLRPRPTINSIEQSSTPDVAGGDKTSDQEVGLRKPLSNRKRKRPTTTDSSAGNNQGFSGGVVERNVAPPVPVVERVTPARRVPNVLRSRPNPVSEHEGPVPYQVQDEKPAIHPVNGQREVLGNFNPNLGVTLQATPSPISGQHLFRRPVGPVAAVAPQAPPQQHFNNNPPSFVDPNAFVNSNIFPGLAGHDNVGFYPGNGFDNVVGGPSNFRSLQQLPGSNEFSSRTSVVNEDDFSSAASTEKESVTGANADAENAAAQEGEKVANDEEKKEPPVKLSPLERLQQNRQSAARKLLAPRKPTEKTTVAPVVASQKPVRKSILPPRQLRPRGKLPGAASPAEEEKPAIETDSNQPSPAVEEKANEEKATNLETSSDTPSAPDAEKDSNTDALPEEKVETSTRKPSLLEMAKRRRVSPASPALSKSPIPLPQKPKTTTPPPKKETEPPQPECEEGQRYNRFLKKCVTMYKPRTQG